MRYEDKNTPFIIGGKSYKGFNFRRDNGQLFFKFEIAPFRHQGFVCHIYLPNHWHYFVAYKSGSANWQKHYGSRKDLVIFGWEMGITQNWNRLPWVSH